MMLVVALTGCQSAPSAAPTPDEVESAAASHSPWRGQVAPPFALQDQNDQARRLEEFRGQWVVLYFYPKDDTPGCTCQATEFTTLLKDFRDMNTVILGVSPDSPSSHQFFRQKYGLDLILLSDTTGQVIRQYGAFRALGIDPNVGRVVRSTFLIDPTGHVAWHWPEVIPQGHAQRVRQKLASLRGS
jgi:peroxiredoxin Q/BCP